DVKVAEAAVEQTLQQIYATRVGLGLVARPAKGKPFTDVPDDLDQDFSTVRRALADLFQSVSPLGYVDGSWKAGPKETVATFLKQDLEGDVDRIYEKLTSNAPLVKQVEATLLQARRDLDQALLNLRYTRLRAPFPGVVVKRYLHLGDFASPG